MSLQQFSTVKYSIILSMVTVEHSGMVQTSLTRLELANAEPCQMVPASLVWSGGSKKPLRCVTTGVARYL